MSSKFVKIVKNAKRGSRYASKLKKQFMLIVFISIILFFGSAYLIWVTEMQSRGSYTEAVWTILFTLIGQGEFASNPRTVAGRIIVFLISIFGVALLGVIFSELLQRLMNSKLREMIGMSRCRYHGHTIICGWGERGRIMMQELIGQGKEVAVIANERPQNLPADGVFFIAGSPTDQNILKRAGIEDANAAVILSERSGSISETEADARSILIALAIESMNPDIYSVVELINSDNEKYAQLANVNDIIYSDRLVAEVTATCAAYNGISVFVRDILCSTDDGYHLSAFDIPEEFNGRTVKELFEHVKNDERLPVGIIIPPADNPSANTNLWESSINPKGDTVINPPVKYVCLEKTKNK